jgi:hypothetical protein
MWPLSPQPQVTPMVTVVVVVGVYLCGGGGGGGGYNMPDFGNPARRL